ncbi:MAG: MCE family protein [Betaproteobacteria bacterium]|nr:MCE family protein [Betaproteobacteria bacterium]
MENRAHALVAGLFMLLLGTGVVLAGLWLSREAVETRSYTLVSKYPISGLSPQSPVRYRGVDVGKVDSIEFDPQNPQLVLIRVAVRADTPMTRGTYAQLVTQGVTGLSSVMLDDDGSRPEPLPRDGGAEALIELRPSLLHLLTSAGHDLIADVDAVAERAKTLLSEENQAQFMRVLAGLESAAGRIAALAAAAQPAARMLPEVAADGRRALQRAEVLMGELGELTRQLQGRIDAFDRVARGAEQMAGAAQSASAAVLSESLPRINALVEDLSRTSRSLDRLLGELSEHPQSVLFGRAAPPPGPGEPGFRQEASR